MIAIKDLSKFKATKFYGYRTARVTKRILQVEYDSSDIRITRMVNKWFEEVGCKIDNHVCFELQSVSDDIRIFVSCSDYRITIGLGIIEEYW